MFEIPPDSLAESWALFRRHTSAFAVPMSPELELFTQLMGSWDGTRLECSCKVNGTSIHAARFYLRARSNYERVTAFIEDLKRKLVPELNIAYLSQLMGADFPANSVTGMGIGLDLRDDRPSSRAKLFCQLDSRDDWIDSFMHSQGVDEFRELRCASDRFIFGADLCFDGRTRAKLYPAVEMERLDDPTIVEQVSKLVSREIQDLFKLCMHVNFTMDRGKLVVAFTPEPWEMDKLVSTLANQVLSDIHRHYAGQPVRGRTISLFADEFDAGELLEFNVYYQGFFAPEST